MKNPACRLIILIAGFLGITAPIFADELPIAAVTASANDGNVPANTLDNNLGTRWSALGDGQWIRFDLGSERTIEAMSIAFYRGNARRARFELQVSNDQTTWNTVFNGSSAGTTLAQQRFGFTPVQARYVRYLGHGNTSNMWNSLTEVDVLGAVAVAPPAPTGLNAVPGDRRIQLNWRSVTGATSYRLYRDDTLIASPTDTGFTDTELTNGATYSYRVSAVNNFGEGAKSAAVSASPVAPGACSTTTPNVPGGPDPWGGCWPGPNNTGVPPGTTLTRYDGMLNIYEPGTIIDGLEVFGVIRVLAPHVIIRNTRVHCRHPDFAIAQTAGADIDSSGDDLTIEDTEISGDGIHKCQTGIAGMRPSGPTIRTLTVRRVNIHHVSDGIQPYDGLTVTDSWIHDLTFFRGPTPGEDDHVAAIGYDGGNSFPFVIRHNILDDATPITHGADPNNVIALYAQNGPIANVTVENNLVNGGGHCIWAGNFPANNAGSAYGVRVVNNRFGRKYFPGCGVFGPAIAWSPAPGSEWSGNVWDDTNAPVPAP